MLLARRIVVWILIFLFWGFLATPVMAEKVDGSSSEVQSQPKYVKHIFLFLVPGLTDEVLGNHYLPNIKGLKGEGVTAQGVIKGYPSNRKIELSSILLGNAREDYNQAESAKTLAKLMGKRINDAFILDGQKETRRWGFNSVFDNFKENKPYVNVIIFPESQNGQKSYQEIDRQIGKGVIALREEGLLDYTMIVIAGLSKEIYDKKSPPAELMGLVMRGPNIKVGQKIPVIQQTDIMPTILYASQFKQMPKTDGNVIWNALKVESIPRENNLLYKRIEDLSSIQYRQYKDITSLIMERESYRHEKAEYNRDKEKIQKINEQKDKHIKQQQVRLQLYEWGFMVFFLLVVIGYIAEYFYLRKRFLMF
ncbi:MAG: hypothetical protein M0Z31_13820 [Clostridia bacterium]|nr:hypothetical protein [Clostridia bacterium]